MEAKLKRVKVETLRRRDHDFAVDDASVRQQVHQGVLEVGEVAIERSEVATLDVDLLSVTKHDRPESVPLRFVQKGVIARDRVDELRQHRRNRWFDHHADRRYTTIVESTAFGPRQCSSSAEGSS